MNKRSPIITYEFGTLYIEGQVHKEGDTALSESTFNNLWDFILSSKATDDTDVIMSVHTRGGRRYIKTGRYVGTIQTQNGQIIEVLPKIYKAGGEEEKDKDVCRNIFLNMLRHFTDIKARSFQNATLSTKKGFPILEVYIRNYINAVEQLVLGGLKKGYAPVEENQRFLKGRLDVGKQITMNATNKARFAIKYNKYIEDIPQNRIIVTTLRKLMDDSHSTINKAHISALLTILADIPSSTNIENDLRIATNGNRLFTSYEMLMKWSQQFLLNRGFTTFAGSYVNQSLLFQAERLFEDFVAHLFRKYAHTYNVDAQNTRYFLVDRHNGRRMFQLRPDILVETDKNSLRQECIIIDTKWKAIDGSRPDKHYLIDIKDMYQLYAYGQKYRQGQSQEVGLDVIPKLVLVYPYSEKFTEYLPEFLYEDIKEKIGLKLMVVPFDLTNPSTYEKQIHNIIHCLDVKPEAQPIYKYEYDWEDNTLPLVADSVVPYETSKAISSQTILVGCYKNKEHLDWIMQNNLYNIRLGDRSGAVTKSGLVVSASKLLLYDFHNPKEYKMFELDSSNHIIAKNELMKSKCYPNLKFDREYLLYMITEESRVKPNFDVEELKQTYAPKLKNGSPFFVNL
ncbi:MAG: hypothetical protein J6R48_03850 [Muribaculaceae bacterium]|nr:hypothetical protein [Muribaculaceae bacterium]